MKTYYVMPERVAEALENYRAINGQLKTYMLRQAMAVTFEAFSLTKLAERAESKDMSEALMALSHTFPDRAVSMALACGVSEDDLKAFLSILQSDMKDFFSTINRRQQ